jgi:prepilin-type N-terminal cleavage/methylation domain-containing protein
MKTKVHVKRFTLIELLVAIMVSSIVALLAGTMLYFCFKSWHLNWASAEMQQDGIVAREFMSRRLRVASLDQISLSEIDHRLTISGSPTQEFYLAGDQLVYDPDTGVEGDEVILVRSGLVSFEMSDETPHTVTFTLVLEGGEHNTEITNTIKPRN